MLVSYDPEADAVYVSLRPLAVDEAVHRTVELDEQRNIDYDANGEPVGVEFLWVSDGIDLAGVPRSDEIRDLLLRLPTLQPA
jgi:uncharacterized protein YuzE